MSARDLLRRAREQKKRQLNAKPDTPQLSLPSDSNARTDNKGNLFCLICNLQVKPADANSWKIHVASRRHQQTTKRPHSSIADIGKLSIEAEETGKRQKLDEQEPALPLDYGSDSEESPDEASELPAVTIDAEVEPLASDGEQAAALPTGFFDNAEEQKAAETEALLAHTGEPDGLLDERLAEFESEIAGLTQPLDVQPNNAESAEDVGESEEAELEHQSEMWRQRTDKLIHLRSIIKEGIRDLDPSEPPRANDVEMEEEDDSDDSSSDSEYAELMNWRSSKI
ncbi:hypothetical protein IWW39_002120 [Coemansia spiralis]|uniref:Coiled-coil domain-containing protein 16 n=1 Tax=Coemansia spiralis TaxID=417178 RepID=A0A9W8GNZ6_9FUNG|nr:hypothetical protein IWW39_002120 [Coemansia spiralis]